MQLLFTCFDRTYRLIKEALVPSHDDILLLILSGSLPHHDLTKIGVSYDLSRTPPIDPIIHEKGAIHGILEAFKSSKWGISVDVPLWVPHFACISKLNCSSLPDWSDEMQLNE